MSEFIDMLLGLPLWLLVIIGLLTVGFVISAIKGLVRGALRLVGSIISFALFAGVLFLLVQHFIL